MKERGFTLIELLAVIVVISVISMITVPIVFDEIEKSRMKSFELGVQNTIESAKSYVLENYAENDFPTGGIDITSGDLLLKNNDYISGVIKKDETGAIIAENVSNGKYCANGTKNDLDVINGNCSKLDTTPPAARLKLREKTNNSLLYSLTMSDSGSGIKEYSYCYQNCDKDNSWKLVTEEEPYNKKEMTKSIKLSNLEANKKYTLKVKVVDGNDNKTEVDNEDGITLLIEAPKFEVTTSSYGTKKKVTIIYPSYQEGYTYDYTYNGETVELEAYENKAEFEVSETGQIIARISYKVMDKTEEIISTLNIVNIDNKPPVVKKIERKDNDKWTKSKTVTVNASDEGSGLAFKAYKFDNDNWSNSNTKVYTESGTYQVKVKDKLGNILDDETTKFTITNVDSVKPECKVVVSKADKEVNVNGKVWYVNPFVELTVEDYYLKDGNKIINTAGISKVEMTKTVGIVPGTTKEVTLIDNVYREKIDSSGSNLITFNVTDKAGNIGSCSINLNIDGLTAPTFSKASSQYDSITAEYTAGSATSGIKETNCYLTDQSGNIIEKGSLSENSCIFNVDATKENTTYYFKKCITSNSENTACSKVSSTENVGYCTEGNYTTATSNEKCFYYNECPNYCNGSTVYGTKITTITKTSKYNSLDCGTIISEKENGCSMNCGTPNSLHYSHADYKATFHCEAKDKETGETVKSKDRYKWIVTCTTNSTNNNAVCSETNYVRIKEKSGEPEKTCTQNYATTLSYCKAKYPSTEYTNVKSVVTEGIVEIGE